MSRDSPAAVIVDESGNKVGLILDGTIYRLQAESKIVAPVPLPTGAATEATLATRASQTTLAAVDAKLATIDAVLDSIKDTDGIKKITDPLPAGTNNIGDVDVVSSALPAGAATQATLAAADAKLATIDAVLDSIKDVDGIKKITDPLPAGTNEVGKVAQGTKAAAADGWPVVLYDAAGNPISNRLDDDSNRRLYTTLQGETVSVSIGAIPASPSALVQKKLEATGPTSNMIVDGSVTAVDFEYGPSTGKVGLNELRMFMSGDNINFNGADFGPISALTNGLRISVVINSVETELGIIKVNEEFGLVGSPGTVFYQNTGPADSLAVGFVLVGIILDSATSDVIRVRVQDNLVSVKFKFFQSFVAGVSQ